MTTQGSTRSSSFSHSTSPVGRRRMRSRTGRCAVAMAAVALSASIASAFQVGSLSRSSASPTLDVAASETLHRRPSRLRRKSLLSVLADPSTSVREETNGADDLAGLYFLGARTDDDSGLETQQKVERKRPTVEFTTLSNTSARGKKTRIRRKSENTGVSRSSTMPGFAGESDRQRAYRDGIRLVEERTGKRLKETKEARRRRKKQNGENMYKSSAAVPDSMVKFADEIHREDRITRAEEIELGEKTQEAVRLQNLYDSLEERLNREPTDEEWCAASGKINMEAISQVIEEGLEAKNKLVTSNLRMVQSVVNTYIRNGLSARYNAGDLMQEGIVALIRAAEKFEPDRGWKFSTYAMYWVRASVKRSQIYQSRVITVPPRLYENHKRLLRVEKELEQELDRKPTKQELGAAVGMSELQVNRCLKAMSQQCVSLDQQIKNTRKPMSGDGEADTLGDMVESRTEDGDFDTNQNRMFREALVETLYRHLKPDEVELLLLRYGFKDGPTPKFGRQMTIAELSRIVGLKPDKVRRTINRSLAQLKAVGVDEWHAYERELS